VRFVQALAFSDGARRSTGSTGDRHPRNAQALVNVAYNATLTWANPILTGIEKQVQIPMFGEFPVELGITGKEEQVLARFKSDVNYPTMFERAFPGDPAPISWKNIVYALASFARGLTSFNSPYDRFIAGDKAQMSASAQRGMAMFLSEQLECHHCHTGFNFTASTVTTNSTFIERPFFNTGLYNLDGKGAYPPGNQGIEELTNDPNDMGRFRPPTLRNIALTAPYMHDGSMDTLEEAVRFYERGGRKIETGEFAGDGRLNPHKNGLVAGFQITDAQRQDLINFLISLTDQSFITNPRFSDPFAAGDALQARPQPAPGVYSAPAAVVQPVFGKEEYAARMRAIQQDLTALEEALNKSDLASARLKAQAVHDRLHELHATSWTLGVGPVHNEAEAFQHGRLLTPISSDSMDAPVVIGFVAELRDKLAEMAAQAK
jgi:cytochrome c peroxidase